MKDLNLRGKTIKFLEGNIGVNLQDLGFDNAILDITPKMQTKEKVGKRTSSKLKTFCASKTV